MHHSAKLLQSTALRRCPVTYALLGDRSCDRRYLYRSLGLWAQGSYTSVEDTACGETPNRSPIHSQVATSMLARPWAIPGLSLGPRGCVGVATLPELLPASN